MFRSNEDLRMKLLNRIARKNEPTDALDCALLTPKPESMITKVAVRPNPFQHMITLDVACAMNRSIIVRMFNESNRIVKMFSWYLVRGTNVTAINDLGKLMDGDYLLDIIDTDGLSLYAVRLTKK